MTTDPVDSEPRERSSDRADQDLIGRACAGDREAVGKLFQRHGDGAFRTAMRIFGNATDAEDAVQSAFLRLMTMRSPGDVVNPRAWILAVVVNTCRMAKRRELRSRARNRKFAGDAPTSVGPPILDDHAPVRTALATLPEEYRLPLALRFIEDLTFREIAETLGLNQKTAEGRVQRGLTKLRRHLELNGGSFSILAFARSFDSETAPKRIADVLATEMPMAAAAKGMTLALTLKIVLGAAALSTLGVALHTWSLQQKPEYPSSPQAKSNDEDRTPAGGVKIPARRQFKFDQAVRDRLAKAIKVSTVDQPFDQVIRHLAKLAEVPVEVPAPHSAVVASDAKIIGTFTGTIGGSERQGSIGGPVDNTVASVVRDGKKWYSLAIDQAVPAAAVIAAVCEKEHYGWIAADGKLIVAEAEDLPFDPEIFYASSWTSNLGSDVGKTIAPETDWRKASEFIVGQDTLWREHLDKGYRGYEQTEGQAPPLLALDMALAAVKGHPERDAVRAWLLFQVTNHLENYHGLPAAACLDGCIVAAYREGREIVDSPDGAKSLKELAGLIRSFSDGHTQDIGATTLSDADLVNHDACNAGMNAAKRAADHALAYAVASDVAWQHLRKEGCRHLFAAWHKVAETSDADWTESQIKALQYDLQEARITFKGRDLSPYCIDLAETLAMKKDYAGALKYYEEAQRLGLPADGKGNNSAQSSAKQTPEAEKAQQVNFTFWTGFARAYAKSGQVAKGFALLKERNAKTPFIGFVTAEGLLHEELGEKDKAADCFKRALALDKNNREAQLGLDRLAGRAPKLADQTTAASSKRKADLSDAIFRADSDAQSRIFGQSQPDFAAAFTPELEQIRAAKKEIPGDLEFEIKEIECLGKMRRFDECVAMIKEFDQHHADLAAKYDGTLMLALTTEANANLMRGDKEAALAAIRKAREQFPGSAYLLRQECDYLRRLDRKEEALAMIHAANGKKPGDAQLIGAEFDALQSVGRYHDASALFAKNEKLFTGVQHLVYQSTALWGEGKTQEANSLVDKWMAQNTGADGRRDPRMNLNLIHLLRKRFENPPPEAGVPMGAGPNW